MNLDSNIDTMMNFYTNIVAVKIKTLSCLHDDCVLLLNKFNREHKCETFPFLETF